MAPEIVMLYESDFSDVALSCEDACDSSTCDAGMCDAETGGCDSSCQCDGGG